MGKLATSKNNLYIRLKKEGFGVHKYALLEQEDPMAKARKGGVFDKIKAMVKERTQQKRDRLRAEDQD